MNKKLLRALAAFALSAFAVTAAFALSQDQTRIFPKRAYANYQPLYYRTTINLNDPGIAAGQQFGSLAQNDFVKAIDCAVTTAFNATTSNTITFGTTKTNANEIVGSGITAGTIGVYHLTTALGLGVTATSAADVPLYAKFAQTGTAATAGQVMCVIEFVSNNDM